MLSWGLSEEQAEHWEFWGFWLQDLTDLCLPDELFQKVAEDYVSVAAFQVMTGVYSLPSNISSRLMVSSPVGDLPDHPP